MKTYAAFFDNEIRDESSSGGIFSLIASEFDVIYGTAMTEDCYSCEIVRIEDDISPLRGSKYFQSKVGNAFKQVKKDVLGGKKVLFSGTGCQINGLYMYMGKNYDNLFLLDIICHGVPSPKLWREYVRYQEDKHGKLEAVNFRCKDDGWQDFGMKENHIYISKDKDSFMRMFLRNYCLRPSCYECHAKKFKNADITIADFWGIENVAPEMNDNKGTSLVITRTDKGQSLFEEIKDTLNWKEVSYEEGVRNNHSEYESVVRPIQRDMFYKDLETLTFEGMEKKYASDNEDSIIRKCSRKLKTVVKEFLCGGGAVTQSDFEYGTLMIFKR